jgi:hypothetical protein
MDSPVFWDIMLYSQLLTFNFLTASVKTSNSTNLIILICLPWKGSLSKGNLNIAFFKSYRKTNKNINQLEILFCATA